MGYNPYVDENGDYIVPGSIPGTGDIAAGNAGAPSVIPQPVDSESAPVPKAAEPVVNPTPAPTPTAEETPVTPTAKAPVTPPATPQKAPALDDIGAADKAQSDAIATSQQATFDADMAQYKAKAQVQDQTAKAQTDYATGLAQIDAHEQMAREQAHKDAAAETASWMHQMDDLSKQEPNRGRYWENQSGFGKAMWILGVAATAIANAGHPGMPNMALGLLQQEVQNDVQDQKDRLGRQIDQGKIAGKMMVDRENQRLTDIHDDFAKEVTRYGALRDAALTKAAVYPPGTQMNLAWTAAAQEADKARVTVATKKQEQAVAFKEKAITEAGANGRAALERANAYAIAKMHDATTNRIADQNNTRDYELAQLRAEIKQMKDGTGPNAGYDFQIPTDSGFSVVSTIPGTPNKRIPGLGEIPGTGVPAAAPRPLGIKKEQQEKATQTAISYTNQLTYLKHLRSQMEDATTFGYLTNSDAALRSAEMSARSEAAKTINGGGRLNDKDMENGAIASIGVNIESLFDKIRQGADRKQALAILDHQISALGGRAEMDMTTRFGTNLRPGEKLVFNPEQAYNAMNGQPSDAPGAEEQDIKAGGKSEAVAPKTVDEYRSLKTQEGIVGPGLIKELPSGVRGIVGDAVDNMQSATGNHVQQQFHGAYQALIDYEKSHPAEKQAVDQAKLQLEAEEQDAFKAALKNEKETVTQVLANTVAVHKPLTADALEVSLQKGQFSNTTPAERAKLLKDINQTLIDTSKKHEEEYPGQPMGFDEIMDTINDRYGK